MNSDREPWYEVSKKVRQFEFNQTFLFNFHGYGIILKFHNLSPIVICEARARLSRLPLAFGLYAYNGHVDLVLVVLALFSFSIVFTEFEEW